jgi:uncharacterized protein (TIGR03435 family)
MSRSVGRAIMEAANCTTTSAVQGHNSTRAGHRSHRTPFGELMIKPVVALSLFVLCGAVLTAQGSTARWEAVSIKPVRESPPPGAYARGANVFSRPYTTLHQLLTYAYELPAYSIVGGPSWLTANRYAVLGKTDAPTAPNEMRVLVQQLLAERSGLKFHRETREMTAYDLSFAREDRKLGPRLKPTSIDCMPFLTGERPPSESPVMEVPGLGPRPKCVNGASINMRTGVLTPTLNGVTIARFANYLQGRTHRPVRDQTRLPGLFDVELSFVDEDLPKVAGFDQTPRPEGLSLHTALRDQLGLKLEPTRTLVDVLVIDFVSMPDPD